MPFSGILKHNEAAILLFLNVDKNMGQSLSVTKTSTQLKRAVYFCVIERKIQYIKKNEYEKITV